MIGDGKIHRVTPVIIKGKLGYGSVSLSVAQTHRQQQQGEKRKKVFA